jgi:hypothetical protein
MVAASPVAKASLILSLCANQTSLEKVPAAGKRIPNKQQPPVGLAVGQEPKAGAANESQEQDDEYENQVIAPLW